MLQTNEKDYKKTESIALYCRVGSGTIQADAWAIEHQKKALAQWAADRGFTPEQLVYLVDIGFSGCTLDRPGIRQFLSGDRKYTMLVAVNFSRFARDLSLVDALVDYADTQGATIYALKEQISLNQWKHEQDQLVYTLLKGGADK